MAVGSKIRCCINGITKTWWVLTSQGTGKLCTIHLSKFSTVPSEMSLNTYWFFPLEDVQEKLDIWWDVYNNLRPHSSLGDMSSNEYIEMKENAPDFLIVKGA